MATVADYEAPSIERPGRRRAVLRSNRLKRAATLVGRAPSLQIQRAMAGGKRRAAERARGAPRGERPETRTRRVMHRDRPSINGGIADAVVMKAGELFFLAQPTGDVPLSNPNGFGLYYHDCRYLDGYELKLGGHAPQALAADASRGCQATFWLTNPDLTTDDGVIAKEDVSIRWIRLLESKRPVLHDVITVRNFGAEHLELGLELEFTAEFEPVFVVRGMSPERLGRLRPPKWHHGELLFRYDGADGLFRTLAIAFSPPPAATEGTAAKFAIALAPQTEFRLEVSLSAGEAERRRLLPRTNTGVDEQQIVRDAMREAHAALSAQTRVTSDDVPLNRLLERSVRDLHLLTTTLRGHRFFAAGVPWYVALFGRDALVASLETLAYEPGVAADTLRLLARLQGTKDDSWRDEAPGKIMHELRVGELARLGEIPQTPYYGSVDSTPLFLVVLTQYLAWTGDMVLVRELEPAIRAALEWIRSASDVAGDYLAYATTSDKGLTNQGWKDSGDAIVNADGTLARPPIALSEVQGYVYLAKTGLADVYARLDDAVTADRLRAEAQDLRRRFNVDFWLADRGIYALALQDGGAPAAVVSSNAGQVLWSGIADDDKARATTRQLMSDAMFSGWGIRTLASDERRFNPVGYHLGTVWPHDNALIGAGLRRYGFDDEALRIFTGLRDAASHFEHDRLPEVFAGFARDGDGPPVRYPVACHPQAWAAGSMLYLLTALLGLHPNALERRLAVVRPLLPEGVRRAELSGLRVGDARIDLEFVRDANGRTQPIVRHVDGELQVTLEDRAAA
jgi:glycogen debranching enzyme